MKSVAFGALALAMALPGIAQAADKPDDIIAGRQAGFDLVQGILVAMKTTIDGGGSVKPLTDGAKGLVSWGHAIPGMFPPGTETGHSTKAKAEIWSDQATFDKDAANLATAAEKLTVLAEADDKAGFAAQFKEMGGACGACHRAFRER